MLTAVRLAQRVSAHAILRAHTQLFHMLPKLRRDSPNKESPWDFKAKSASSPQPRARFKPVQRRVPERSEADAGFLMRRPVCLVRREDSVVDFWPRAQPLHDPPRRRKSSLVARSSRPTATANTWREPWMQPRPARRWQSKPKRSADRSRSRHRRPWQSQDSLAQRRQEQEKAHRPSPPHSPPQSPAAT